MFNIFSGSPTLIAITFIAGLGVGASGAWYVQNLRVNSIQSEFSQFVSVTKVKGEAAEKAAIMQTQADRQLKEASDREYQITITNLTTDINRLRNTRARVGILPSAATGSKNPDVACFDRADLERALQQFDAGTTKLIAEGDQNTVGLNIAKQWAQRIQSNISLDNQANN